MLVAVYPSIEVLAELGRVTVAGSRLDLRMGLLWSHLDRDADESKVRREAGAVQHDNIYKLAKSRLHGDLQAVVLEVIEIADQARKRRNEVVHQDWVLRGLDAMRPVSDFAHLRGADLEAYRVEWEREARESDDWQRVPHDSIEVVPAQTLSELREVERALSYATDLTYWVASAREGFPPGGWLDRASWGPYRTPPKLAKVPQSSIS